MEADKKIEVIFSPGCFDTFEGTQEELDEMIADIKRMAESGEFMECAEPLTMEQFEDLPEEVRVQLFMGMLAEMTEEQRVALLEEMGIELEEFAEGETPQHRRLN
jgi:hypothetical protein